MSLDTHHHHYAKPDYNLAFAIGVALNSITAWFFVSGKGHDLNTRGAYLHMHWYLWGLLYPVS